MQINKGEITYSQHCKNTKKTNNNLIGNKRPRNDTNNSNNDLISMIDDFIYTKKKMLNENEYEERFIKIKESLNDFCGEGIEMINTNGFNSIVKLMRFMTCTRNFTNDDIKKKKIFEELKEKMKNIIVSKLFDCSHLEEEILSEKENKDYKEKEKDKKLIDISPIELINQINSTLEESDDSPKETKICKDLSKDLKDSQSVSESSINLSSGTKTDYDDLKNKIRISPLDNISLHNILKSFIVSDSIDIIKSNIENVSSNSNIELKSRIKSLITALIKSNCCNSKIIVKSPYLRKRVCCKLYNVFHILFTNMNNISDDEIKNLCVALEAKARAIDAEMSPQYKSYIANIFKKIKAYFLS